MRPRGRVSIRAKLTLLAGVPVLGALVLALFVGSDAQRGAHAAASLGSIEDLARLTSSMAGLLHAAEDERAATAILEGGQAASPPRPEPRGIDGVRHETDEAARRLEAFLAARDASKLPARLTRGLGSTRKALGELQSLRARVDRERVGGGEIMDTYGAATSGLVEASAALAELTDDGAMLRNISATVSLFQLEEEVSVEDAIVGYVAARGVFPAGAFKALVTANTEEHVYEVAFRGNAADDVLQDFTAARSRGDGAAAAIDAVLKSTEDTVTMDPSAWDTSAATAMTALREVERVLLSRIETAASMKAAELRRLVRWSVAVMIGVIVVSMAMAIFVRHGIQASVTALTEAAERVRKSRDFSVRAERVSDDELGMLTETFNEMLSGMQSRDAELEQHRSHLEGLVVARTSELAARNTAMRLVLNNVDQGLATIGLGGRLGSERSAAFDEAFSPQGNDVPFYDALAGGDERLRLLLKLGWEQVEEGLLPVEVSLDQLPRRFDSGSRHFTLAVKPIADGGAVTGALLVLSDVTLELEAQLEQARQREEIRVFQRIARDKAAFVAFLEETGTLVERLREERGMSADEQLAVVHTVKGNASQSEVRSVADAAHALESVLVETRRPAVRTELFPLLRAWDAIGLQVGAFLGAADAKLEVSSGELDRLIRSVEDGLGKQDIVARLRSFHDEPVSARLARLGEHAERLAARLGKPVPAIEVSAGDLRLPRGRYGQLWANLVHVVRNAVDHGLEGAAQRTSSGKPGPGSLSLRAWAEGGAATLEIADDGAGIDWDGVAEKARRAGLPAATREDVERALFTSGVTTLDAVTDTSGRGVGLAAVWATVAKLGGSVRVESERGRGTRFRLHIPLFKPANGRASVP